jgi:hypothetical protein
VQQQCTWRLQLVLQVLTLLVTVDLKPMWATFDMQGLWVTVGKGDCPVAHVARDTGQPAINWLTCATCVAHSCHWFALVALHDMPHCGTQRHTCVCQQGQRCRPSHPPPPPPPGPPPPPIWGARAVGGAVLLRPPVVLVCRACTAQVWHILPNMCVV